MRPLRFPTLCLLAVMAAHGSGCRNEPAQQSSVAQTASASRPATAQNASRASSAPSAQETSAQPQNADAGGIELVPGERLGVVRLGMTYSELQQMFGVGSFPNLLAGREHELFSAKAGILELSIENQKVTQVSVALTDAKWITVSGKPIKPGLSLKEASTLLPWCQHDPVRGGIVYKCDGSRVYIPGPTDDPAAMVFSVNAKDPAHPKKYVPIPR